MAYSVEQLKKYRTPFGWVFLVSFLILMVFSYFGLKLSEPKVTPPGNGGIDLAPGSTITLLTAVVSLLTSLTSLLGVLFTTELPGVRNGVSTNTPISDLKKNDSKLRGFAKSFYVAEMKMIRRGSNLPGLTWYQHNPPQGGFVPRIGPVMAGVRRVMYRLHRT